jgi:hypothetical protein
MVGTTGSEPEHPAVRSHSLPAELRATKISGVLPADMSLECALSILIRTTNFLILTNLRRAAQIKKMSN